MGFTCKVVRGISAFTPYLEHVRAWGGGGSVANTLVCICICRGLFFAFRSLRTCTK